MSSKTVWVASGLVLAVSAVAYLSYHDSSAGKDAAGTIMEAKRAQVDATGGSGTSQTGTSNTGDVSGSGASDRGDVASGGDANGAGDASHRKGDENGDASHR